MEFFGVKEAKKPLMPGFSLKVKAKKLSSSDAKKKSRSIQRRGFKRSSASMENKNSQKIVRARDTKGRYTKKGTQGDKAQTQTIYMPIKQASDGKSAEAIVVKKEKNANKVDVTDVKLEKK